MFNLFLLLIPAIACIARNPTEEKERVHSFEVKYNRARRRDKRQIQPDPTEGISPTTEGAHNFQVKYNLATRRDKRQILPESFLPGPNYPGELSAIPVEKLPAAEAVQVPQAVDQRLPIVQGFPVAERMQEEKVEQVADIDVLPESERMMSDRMRQGRERLLWADDAMVAGIKKTDLNPERVMEGRITDNVDIESVKAMDHWEPDSYPLEATRVLGGEERVMGENFEEGNLEASAVKEEPKLRWGPEIEEKPEEEEGLAKSSLKLDASLAIKGGNNSSETEEKTVKEEEEEQGEGEDKEQVEVDEKCEDKEKSEDEEKNEGQEKGEGEEKGEKEQLDDIKKSLEKVDKKLFLIGSLLDKKFKEVLAQLQNDTGSRRREESTTTKVTARKIDPTLVELAKSTKNDSSTEEPTLVEVKKLAKLAKNDSSTEEPDIKLNPKLGPKRVEVGKSAEN